MRMKHAKLLYTFLRTLIPGRSLSPEAGLERLNKLGAAVLS